MLAGCTPQAAPPGTLPPKEAVRRCRQDRILIVYEWHRNFPYDCIKDTSKITHRIIEEHKYIYIVKHKYFIFESGEHTRIRHSQPIPITLVHTCIHRSSIFSTSKTTTTTTTTTTKSQQQQQQKQNKNNNNIRKQVQLIKFNSTDKIPTHEHLCSDQYYDINSMANPHICYVHSWC